MGEEKDVEVPKQKPKKVPERGTPERREYDRDRKRAQRERDTVTEEELRLRSMDPVDARVEMIMAQIAQEPRQPRPPRVPPEPPKPAGLPSPSVWSRYLKSIPQTQAITEEITRVESAIASGITEFGRPE